MSNHGDPWRLDEWHALPNECLIFGCDSDDIDERGPIWLWDGSAHKACVEHWEAIMGVLGRQHSWENHEDACKGEWDHANGC